MKMMYQLVHRWMEYLRIVIHRFVFGFAQETTCYCGKEGHPFCPQET